MKIFTTTLRSKKMEVILIPAKSVTVVRCI